MKTKYSILTLFIIINVIIMVYIDKVESIINNNHNSNNNKDNDEYSISNNNNNDELCGAPLIYVNNSNNDPDPYNTGRLCIKECCLPCPISDNLYKKDELHKIYYTLNYIRIISFICEIFIVMSYLVLPNKRDHPGITVLFFNVSLLMFLGVSLLDVVKYRDTMCHDAVTQSTFDNNPIICGTQGLALVFATFMLVLWCFLLILQLHCQTVWRSSYIKTHYIFFQIIIFTIAITFTLLSGVTKRINYEFGPFCMVNSEYKYWYFWYPLAVFVIPGFMMHVWTIIYMVRLYWINSMNKTSLSFNSGTVKAQEIVNLLRMQWRVFMLAVSYLSTYIICQLFVILETPKLEVLKLPVNQQPKWTSDWFECIISGKGQDECSQYSIPNVANVNFLIMAETSTASLGISMFTIFCSSKNLWIEWKNLFVRIFNSKSINIGGLK